MARSSLQYRKLLQSLLPKGKLWNRDENSILTKVIWGMSEELARIDQRAENLINEKLLNSTIELIIEHEKDFGIPEEGQELQPTFELRRNELKSKLLEVGQQDKNYFEEISLAFGYHIYIEEFRPAWSGVFCSGDPCGDQQNIFYWKIHIYVDSIIDSLQVDLTKLIAKINKIKPGHTHVLFDFYNVGFDRGFSNGFLRQPHYDNFWLNNSFDSGFSNGFENNTDYYGHNYTGGFGYGFNIAFDRASGGGFQSKAFQKIGFQHPA
jgi:uncharacterized protein YmfQ (DUF2313 family)